LITEVASVEHPVSQANPGYARLHGQDALESYARIVEAVHGAGGRIFPQLVHCGAVRQVGASPNPDLAPLSPSGLYLPFETFGEKPAVRQVAEPASIKDIDAAIDGFASSARHAKAIGFDGVQLHGAHGYLIDQFFWDKMNRRQMFTAAAWSTVPALRPRSYGRCAMPLATIIPFSSAGPNGNSRIIGQSCARRLLNWRIS